MTSMTELLDLALDAHGGLDRWRKLTKITATASISGALFELKGHGGRLGTLQITAETARPHVIYTPFAGSARGEFRPGRVTLTSGDGAVRERAEPRAALAHLARETSWDALHLLYFTGYAMWNYLCLPFLLTWPDIGVEENGPWTEAGQSRRRLRATFPPGFPTHCAEQIFHFDDAGLLRRHDYAPELLGSVPAVLYSDGYEECSGLTVPTRRRVYVRRDDGTADTGVTLVDITISDYHAA